MYSRGGQLLAINRMIVKFVIDILTKTTKSLVNKFICDINTFSNYTLIVFVISKLFVALLAKRRGFITQMSFCHHVEWR